MINRQIGKMFVLLVLIGQLVFPLLPATAKNHPLSSVSAKSPAGVQDLDITISLDWDPASVAVTKTDPPGLTKDEFEDIIKSFAQSLFGMTNGKHRIKNVYVFSNKDYWERVDVRYISTVAGTSKASVSGWKKNAGEILMYVYEEKKDGKWIKDDYPGPVLAHECGHYIYGIYDEYKETRSDGETRDQLKKKNESYLPATDDDGTQKSIMNQHATYPNWFSVEAAYDSAVKKYTAQYRMFEKSIWSVLSSDPAADHANALDDKRAWFEAFKDINVKAEKDLLAKQDEALTGYDEAPINIVWMKKTSYLILVLDNSISDTAWAQALKSGAAAVRAMTAGNWVSVLSGNNIVIDKTQLTSANRSTLITQIASLKQGTAATVEKSLQAAIDQAKAYGKAGTEATYFAYLLTSGNPVVSSTMKEKFTENKVMLSVASMFKTRMTEKEEGQITVKELSVASGGRNNVASRAQTMESQVARSINFMEGENISDIAADVFPGSLTSGSSRTMTFTVGPQDGTVTVAMFADEGEWDNIQPSLIDPAGNVFTEGSLATGISLEKDEATGVWLFSIDTSMYSGVLGKWSASMMALTSTEEPLAMFVSVDSNLALQVEVTESPLFGYVAKASLTADRPILNARVTAVIYDTDGVVVETLTLNDEGTNGDVKAGDGIYSARITIAPNDEEYAIVARADDNSGLALESDRKMVFVSNANINEALTGAFQRTDESAFTMNLSSGSGGRCFIAQAAYGSYLDPHVSALRSFRDRYLLPFGPGRMLVRFYYAHSPDWAAFIRQHQAARVIARGILTPVVYCVRYPFLPVAGIFIVIGYTRRKRWIPAVKSFFR